MARVSRSSTKSINMEDRFKDNMENAASYLLGRPLGQPVERNGGTYHVVAAIPAYLPDAQVTQANGRIVSNNALAPLVGKRYRMRLQARLGPGSPTYLEPEPPLGSPGVSQNPY